MMIIDASVWVSYFIRQDRYHAKSHAWLDRQITAGATLIAPIVLLPEVAGPVARQTKQPHLAQQALKSMLSLPMFQLEVINAPLGRLSAQIAIDLMLSGADAVYVALAYKLSVPLVSWDGEHLTRGGRLVTVITPH
jgi:predicted nucleic acid-binding protein